jgi:hypothetical protein
VIGGVGLLLSILSKEETSMKAHGYLFCLVVLCVGMFSLEGLAASQQRRRRAPRAKPTTTSTPAPAPATSSKNLTRPVAADLIRRDGAFRSTQNADVPVGRFWLNSQSMDSAYTADHINDIHSLEGNGVLTFDKTGKTYVFWVEYTVQLTAKGEEEAKSWSKGTDEELFLFLYGPAQYGLPDRPDGTLFHIPLATKQLVEVTGITFDPSHTRAQVEFTWKWVPTANAKFLPNKAPSDAIQSAASMCALYDDGWRCSLRPY